MIESLTKEQESRLTEFRDKWTAIGLNTDRANRSVAEQACKDAYKIAGLEEPKIILWAQSPLGLLLTAKLAKEISKNGLNPYKDGMTSVRDSVWASVGASVRDSVEASVRDSVWNSVGVSVRASVRDSVWASVRASVIDSVGASVRASVRDSVWASVSASVIDSVWASVRASVWDSVGASVGDSVADSVADSKLKDEWNNLYSWGQHDANWLGFYDYFREVCELKDATSKLEPLTRLSKETGWHLFYKNIAILSEKPTILHKNDRDQLHNPNGPAIEWADGYKLYRLNGIRIDGKEWIASKSINEFTKDDIVKEENADIRREIIRKIGMDQLAKLLEYKIIDSFDGYELITFDIGDNRIRPFLKMNNPSMAGVTHIEGVRPEIKTVKEALCYRNGLNEYVAPLALS